jgi:hypothetical protein
MSIDNICEFMEENWFEMTCILTLGAATATASKAAVDVFGHSISKYECGINSTPLLATIGAIQQLAPFFITEFLNEDVHKKNKHNVSEKRKNIQNHIVAHVISAAVLVGLTGLAAKTHLIASGLTLFGGAVLCTSSCLTNGLYWRIMEYINED